MKRFDLWLKEHNMTLNDFRTRNSVLITDVIAQVRADRLKKIAEDHHELLKSLEDK